MRISSVDARLHRRLGFVTDECEVGLLGRRKGNRLQLRAAEMDVLLAADFAEQAEAAGSFDDEGQDVLRNLCIDAQVIEDIAPDLLARER